MNSARAERTIFLPVNGVFRLVFFNKEMFRHPLISVDVCADPQNGLCHSDCPAHSDHLPAALALSSPSGIAVWDGHLRHCDIVTGGLLVCCPALAS